MDLRKTLLAALAFLVLGGYLYFFETDKEPGQKGKRFFAFKEEEVEGLTLGYPDREIRIEKEPSGRWKITHPLETPADESTVAGMLAALHATEIERTLQEDPSQADLKAFGLDAPRVKVSIALRNQKSPLGLSVGARTPLGNFAYARRGTDSPVLLTEAALASRLEKTLYDLRDKTIFTLAPDRVSKVQISRPKESVTLVKDAKEEWIIEGPSRKRTQERSVTDYLTILSRLKAKGFASDEAKAAQQYGLDRPSLKITLGGDDGKQLGALLLRDGANAEYYAKREDNPTVYVIEEFFYRQLDKRAGDFLGEETKK